MAKRFHLEQVHTPDGSIWFTLIFESYTHFFVERYNDSNKQFVTDRQKNIPLKEFDEYEVNGVPLEKMVALKLEEIQASETRLAKVLKDKRRQS